MKSTDDGFRKQLEAKELSYADRLRELTNQYELRIAEEQHSVCVILNYLLLVQVQWSKLVFYVQVALLPGFETVVGEPQWIYHEI